MRSRPFFSLRKMRMRMALGLCLGLCTRVSLCPRVLPLRATERPTEGTYGFSAIWVQYGVFSLFKSYGVKKPTSLCMTLCLPQHDMAPMERHLARYFGLFWFFQSLTAGYKLPGIVRERATSDSPVQLVQGFYTSMFVNACAF